MKRFKIDIETGKDKEYGYYLWITDNGARMCKVFGKDTAEVDMKAERIVEALNAMSGKPHSNPHNTWK